MDEPPTRTMQYFRPGGSRFVGDCMPFYHDGVWHLFYLLDENHHQALGGLGGHQWAHASTTDLIHWTHHPLALAIEHPWEGSICTGSILACEGAYHAFYATRKPDRTQHLGHAVSRDGVHFAKCAPNPFFSPPSRCSPCDCRDPFAFRGTSGRVHLLVTARMAEFPLHDRGGCLLHLTSDDLSTWTEEAHPFFVPGGEPGYRSVPECPDYFRWNDWYYLLFGLDLRTRYRMSRHPSGPWIKPRVDVLDSPLTAVMKTAPFGEHRRIGAGWLGSREGDRNEGARLWGGNLVLRELVQNEDGTLGTRFLPEQRLPAGAPVAPLFRALTGGVVAEPGGARLSTPETQAVAALEAVPLDCRIEAKVQPGAGFGRFGLGLRGRGRYESKADLVFDPGLQTVTLAGEVLEGVEFLGAPFDLEVVCREDILDVCLGGRRCLINRLPESRGPALFLFVEHGEVAFRDLRIEPLRAPAFTGG